MPDPFHLRAVSDSKDKFIMWLAVNLFASSLYLGFAISRNRLCSLIAASEALNQKNFSVHERAPACGQRVLPAPVSRVSVSISLAPTSASANACPIGARILAAPR